MSEVDLSELRLPLGALYNSGQLSSTVRSFCAIALYLLTKHSGKHNKTYLSVAIAATKRELTGSGSRCTDLSKSIQQEEHALVAS